MTKLLTQETRENRNQTVIAYSEEERKVYVDGRPCPLTSQEFRL